MSILLFRPLALLLSLMTILSLFLPDTAWSDGPIEKILPTTTRQVKAFRHISFSLPAKLIVTQGPSEQLTITAPPEYFDEILTTVDAGHLVIRQKSSTWPAHSPLYLIPDGNPVTVRVTVTSLQSIEMTGSGKLKLYQIDTDSFLLTQTGSGSANLDLSTENLTIHMKGAGKLNVENLKTERCKLEMHGTCKANLHLYTDKLIARLTGGVQLMAKGKAVRQQIQLTGSGVVDTLPMQCKHAAIKLTGSGKIRVQARTSFLADLRGSGMIVYQGDPELRQINVLGTGKIRKVLPGSGDLNP